MQRRVGFGTLVAVTAASLAVFGPLLASRTFAWQAASPVASPQLAATPVPTNLPTPADLGLTLPAGIDVIPLAATTIDQAAGATALRLQEVIVPPASRLASHTPVGPELLYGELGTATVVDALGLQAPLAAGGQAALKPGSAYTLKNAGTAPATLLRVSLGASSTAPEPGVQTLLEGTLPTPPTTPATLLLARASWQPGADTGTITAAGPVGIVVTHGTLTVTSPSGLEAPLAQTQGLVFPAGVAQRERNAGNEPAQALLVAVAPTGQSLIAAVPTPTSVPTVTPPPTATPVPTVTPMPTATPLPTATATFPPTETPTAAPTATATPDPAIGQVQAVLQEYQQGFDNCDAEGVADLFKLPSTYRSRKDGESDYNEVTNSDRSSLIESWRCDVNITQITFKFDQVVIHVSGDTATLAFHYTNEYDYNSPPDYCTEGRQTWQLERQPTGKWLITDDTIDFEQTSCPG